MCLTGSPSPTTLTQSPSPFFGGSKPSSGPGKTSSTEASRNQLLAELGAAFSGMEGYDEASSVGQAQLGSQMQSQLRNLGDLNRDTPRSNALSVPGLPTASSFGSPSAWGAASPKARAATTRPSQIPAPGPSYDGPRLEPPDAPLTIDWVMGLVRHFQHHPHVCLPARYLCRLLDDGEKVMEARDKEGPVQQITVHGRPGASPRAGTLQAPGENPAQLIIVGDLHGQLADLLWIFYKMGCPSPTNRFLFNGDICDRGTMATEIWAILLAFMTVWPESVSIHRGNHEDRLLNMDFHCGGFYDEVLGKYGREGTGAMVYEKFARIFARLPLASIVDNQIFVVHGGLSRGAAGGFLRLLRSCRVRAPEVPAASACATASDLAFVDAMWADPQEHPGTAPNPRGAGLALFGPDVTARFLAEIGCTLVVRSHQVPSNNDGFFVHHGGKLMTVFSASNYCGLTGNQGAVLAVRPDGSLEAVRHWAPPFDKLAEVLIEAPNIAADAVTPMSVLRSRALQRQTTAGALESMAKTAESTGPEAKDRALRLEREVLAGAARFVVEHKAELFSFWEQCDSVPPRGFINKKDWEEGMRSVLGDSLPWKAIGKVLRVKDTLTKDVDYRRFLSRFRVTVVGGPTGGERWAEELLGRFYGRLLALKGDAASLQELQGFLAGEDGQVAPARALYLFQFVLGPYVTEEQAMMMLRTLAAHSASDSAHIGQPLGVFEFLSQLDICFQHQTSVAGNKSKKAQAQPSPWVKSVLAHLGRLMYMEDAGGSPKAGSQRMLEVFRFFDQDGDGLLQRDEFSEAVRKLLSLYSKELPAALSVESATEKLINELADTVDISEDGVVNYLEFLHAFQPVDLTPNRGLRQDLMEQICTTIWANKGSLLRTLQVVEEDTHGGAPTGRVSKEALRRTLRSLNASLEAARGGGHGAPLTQDQIDIIVDHASVGEDGTLDYQAFLESFQVIDMGAPPDEDPPIPLAPVLSAAGTVMPRVSPLQSPRWQLATGSSRLAVPMSVPPAAIPQQPQQPPLSTKAFQTNVKL